jgi:hypothetical protein
LSARPVGEPAGPGLSVAKTLRFRGKVGKDPKVLLSGGIAEEVVCSCPTKAGVDYRVPGLLRFRETKPFGVGETAGSSGSRSLRESTGGALLERGGQVVRWSGGQAVQNTSAQGESSERVPKSSSGGIAGEAVYPCPTKAGVYHRVLGLLRFREIKPFGVGETAGSSGSRPPRESTGGALLEHAARR